jgi:predicted CXXCH cytochrome family protein
MALIGRRGTVVLVAVVICMLSGCDSLARHKIAATIFDGVPSMPPAEQYCEDYHKQAVVEEIEAEKKKQMASEKQSASAHPPYTDKNCNGCHDKNSESGFVTEKNMLCSVCHPGFVKGAFSHGPAAVGACLSCHVPHDSKYPSLLKKPVNEICGTCHLEQRLTRSMHDKVVSRGMNCTECHDPHSGPNRFFLK